MVGKLDLVVLEGLLLHEEDESEAVPLPTGRFHRDGQKRREPRLAGELLPVLAEAIVALDPRRREDALPLRSAEERLGAVEPLSEEGHGAVGKLMGACQEQLRGFRHQHGRERPPERLARRLRDSVQRLGQGQRLREDGSDPEEPALDSHLPAALLDARDVAKRDRAEVRERLEHVHVLLRERAIRIARADPDHAAHLAPPRHGSARTPATRMPWCA